VCAFRTGSSNCIRHKVLRMRGCRILTRDHLMVCGQYLYVSTVGQYCRLYGVRREALTLALAIRVAIREE
jgi:hypothetical protein